MIYWNILLLAVICVIVTDLTDFFDYVKKLIWILAFGHNKPYKELRIKLLDCSLCQTFWLSIIYVIWVGKVGIGILAYILIVAYLTTVIRDIIVMVRDYLVKLIDCVYKILWLDK